MLLFGIIVITPFAIISLSILGSELIKSGLLNKFYYTKNVRKKEQDINREIEKITGEEYNLKREKNIVFPDEVKKYKSRHGTPNKNKRVFVSETPEIKMYNVSNAEENRRSQNGKFYQEEVEESVQDTFEEDDDPIMEYGLFKKKKK